jgi:hypothetical protein
LPSTTLSLWNAQIVRVTFFLSRAFDAIGLWSRYLGEDPTIDEVRPREFMRRQAGPFGRGLLEIQSSNPRMDWLLTPPPENTPGALPPPFFAPVDEALETLDKVIEPWLRDAPLIETTRVAFGVTALLPVQNKAAAYEQLQRLLPSIKTLDPENSSDFFYQINRPSASRSLSGVKFNRLTRWSSIVARRATLVATNTGMKTISDPYSEHFVSVDCDLNTPGENDANLEVDQLIAIYRELREMATENIERGEFA